jgi:hypothetical protein
MPVTYIIDGKAKLICTACSSPLTFADVLGHFKTLRDDPACVGRLDVLLDVSEADAVPASNQLGAVATELAAVRAKVRFGRCAVAATRDAMFGMMRMFEVLAGRYFESIQVFRTVAEAEAWLAAEGAASTNPETAPSTI